MQQTGRHVLNKHQEKSPQVYELVIFVGVGQGEEGHYIGSVQIKKLS